MSAIQIFKSTLSEMMNRGLTIEEKSFFNFLVNASEYQGELFALKDEIKHLSNIYLTDHIWEKIFKYDCYELIIFGPEEIKIDQGAGLTNIKLDENLDFELIFSILTYKTKHSFNQSFPFVSFTFDFKDKNARATILHSSLFSNNHSKLYLRFFPEKNLALHNLGLTLNSMSYIREAIKNRDNVIITGATASGKTTLLKAMIDEVPDNEHLVIIEDLEEIKSAKKNVSNLICKEHTPKMNDYCSFALRMRPDRIILGEIRSVEVAPFLLTMNSGHQGMLSTLHANSAIDAFERLATLFLLYVGKGDINQQAVINMIARSVKTIIHMEDKKVAQIIKVLGSENGIPYYERVI